MVAFFKQKKWIECSRKGFCSLCFSYSNDAIPTLRERLRKCTDKKHAQVLPNGSYEELIIADDESPLFPDDSLEYKVMHKGRWVSAVYVAFFDLSDIQAMGGTLVVVGQRADGFSGLEEDAARGLKEFNKAMNSIDSLCSVDGVAMLHEMLDEQYSTLPDARKAPGLTKGAKIAIGLGIGAFVAFAVYAMANKDNDETEGEVVDTSTFDNAIAAVVDGVSSSLLDAETSPAPFDALSINPPDDGIARKSARQLGGMVGMSAREVNLALRDLGYLTGEPGNWQLTNKGAERAILRCEGNEYGGSAHRSWEWPMWNEDIVYELGDPEKHLEEINRNRASVGLEPLDSL